MYTDDEHEAIEFCYLKRLRGEENVAVGTVKNMLNPPETAYKYIVYRVKEL